MDALYKVKIPDIYWHTEDKHLMHGSDPLKTLYKISTKS